MQKLINRTQSLDNSHSMYQAHSKKFQPNSLIQVPHCTAQGVYWYVYRSRFTLYIYCFPFSGFNRKPSSKCKAQFQRMLLLYYFQFILLFFHLFKYILVPTLKYNSSFNLWYIPSLRIVLPFSSCKGLLWILWIKIYFY